MKFLQYLQRLRSVCVCCAVVGFSSVLVETLSLFLHVGVNQHLSDGQYHLIIMSTHTALIQHALMQTHTHTHSERVGATVMQTHTSAPPQTHNILYIHQKDTLQLIDTNMFFFFTPKQQVAAWSHKRLFSKFKTIIIVRTNLKRCLCDPFQSHSHVNCHYSDYQYKLFNYSLLTQTICIFLSLAF